MRRTAALAVMVLSLGTFHASTAGAASHEREATATIGPTRHAGPSIAAGVAAHFRDRAVDDPPVRVIVTFVGKDMTRGKVPSRAEIASARTMALRSLPRGSYRLVSAFDRIAAATIEMNAAAYAVLRSSPWVDSVSLDQTLRTTMDEANALTGANVVHATGVTGAGVTVAIIDTGVDSNAGVVHPSLADDLLGQACFRVEGDCLGGPSNAEDEGGHGTHVAGIITGPKGVAPDAQFYALKVFATGSTSDTNILSALNYVIGLNATTPGTVDVINMSIGGSEYPDQASCDANSSAYVNAFASLNSQGVIVFVGSGNGAQTDRVSSPGCVTGAVGVGSVGDANMTNYFAICTDHSGPDRVSCYSNTTAVQGDGELIDLLAPGCSISSLGLDGATAVTKCGTSMATPYAAGTAALALQALADHGRTATPAALEDLLERTGVPVSDHRLAPGSPTFPRVNPLSLISALQVEAPGGFRITGSTSSAVDTAWDAVAGADGYTLHRSLDGAEAIEIADLPGTLTTFTDAAAPCGRLTYFARASVAGIEGFVSGTATTTLRECPLAPTGLSVSATPQSGKLLTWTDVNPVDTSFLVQRSVNGGVFTTLAIVSSSGTPNYIDNSPVCGVNAYRVIADRNGDLSPSSTVVSSPQVCSPTNDNFTAAEVITPGPVGTTTTDTEPFVSYATEEAVDPQFECRYGVPGAAFQTVWYTITPTLPIRVTVSTSATELTDPVVRYPNTLLGVYTGGAGTLTTVACNDDISDTNRNSAITVNLEPSVTYRVAVGQSTKVPAGTAGNVVVSFTWSAPVTAPDNDLIAHARTLPAVPSTIDAVSSAQNATTSADDPVHQCADLGPRRGSHTLWWTFTAPMDGMLSVDTLQSASPFDDTVLSVYTGSPGSLTSVACNENAAPRNIRSLISGLSVTAATTYWVMVSRWSDVPITTPGTLLLGFRYTPSQVTVSPATVNISEGGADATYQLALSTTPTANVTIDVAGDGQCTVSPSRITFTPADRSIAQTVSVRALEDFLAEGQHTCTISHVATSSDPTWHQREIASVTGTITDQVIGAGIDITKTTVTATMPEPGGLFVHAITVHNPTAAPVTITALTDDDTLSNECLQLVDTVLTADDGSAGGPDEASCTSSGTHTVADTYTTTASVTVRNDYGSVATAQASTTVEVSDNVPTSADIDVQATTNASVLPRKGGDVTFTIVVVNNSPEPLVITSLTDAVQQLSTRCPSAVGTVISPSGRYTCVFIAHLSAPKSGIPAPPYTSTVTAEVEDHQHNAAFGTATVTVAYRTNGPHDLPRPPTPRRPAVGDSTALLRTDSAATRDHDQRWRNLDDAVVRWDRRGCPASDPSLRAGSISKARRVRRPG